MKLQNKDNLLIGCVYRSPNSDMRNNVELTTNLKTICERNQFTHVLICGDFNLPEIEEEEEEMCLFNIVCRYTNSTM